MRAYYDVVGRSSLAARVAARRGFGSGYLSMQIQSRNFLAVVTLVVLALGASGCVYRANISQGNIVEEEDLDQVEVGMTRSQVRFLLGTPMIEDPFHQDRWDYVYYVTIGRNDASAKRWITVLFADDKVSEIRRNQELNPDL